MSSRPNVIVILTDQQRWDTTTDAGCPLDLTPTLDALGRRGLVVETALSPNPLCAPTRASLQTGVYPTVHGVTHNGIRIPDDLPTLARCFNEAGYQTSYIGKWHLADEEHVGPVPEDQRGGYTSWLAANTLEFTSDAYRTIVFDEQDEAVQLPGYRADALVDAAIRFVADSVEEPFLLFLSLLEPHQQNETDDCPAPAGYAEKYAGRWLPPDLAALGGDAHRLAGGYFGQVKRVDEALGRLMDALRSLEVEDSTVVAFTSDHASHFRTRNGEFKRSCHDGSARVPLVFHGGPFTGGGRVTRQASLVDLPPTLLDAAGLDIPEGWQGHSLLRPLPEGRADEAYGQLSELSVGRFLRTPRWKYCVVAPDANPRREHSSEVYTEDALYDLEHDPYELLNLVGNPRFEEVRVMLRARLTEWIRRVEGRATRIEPAPEKRHRRFPEPRVHTDGWKPSRFGHQSPA